MAFSDPEVYFNLLIKPMLKRFEQEPTAYELAFSSCVLLNHFADVYAKDRELSVKDTRTFLREHSAEFAKIEALANASKHVEVDARHGVYEGTRAEHATIGSGAAFSDGSYFSDGSSFDDAEETVTITLPNGEHCDVLHLCKSVAAKMGELVLPA